LAPAESEELMRLFDRALPQVYDYVLHRIGDRQVAEDLTSETMLGAYTTALKQGVAVFSVAWLIGIARHKLVDHWRRQEREGRRFLALTARPDEALDGPLEAGRASDVLAMLNPSQRAALTLRYVDGLPVAEVAGLLGRSVGATEMLLVRAKQAFRDRYAQSGAGSDD
jgi:RNA polymerase sigma-70 factor, ECF subfamily